MWRTWTRRTLDARVRHQGPELEADGGPLLLIDVDGVISPVGPSTAWPDFTSVDDAPYLLQVSRGMGERLRALPATRAWLTSWDHLANEWVAPALGWNPLPIVTWPGGPAGPRSNDLKADGLKEVLARLDTRPERIVWLDDVLGADGSLRRLGQQVLGDIPHLLIAPDPTIGLTPADIDCIGDFLHTG